MRVQRLSRRPPALPAPRAGDGRVSRAVAYSRAPRAAALAPLRPLAAHVPEPGQRRPGGYCYYLPGEMAAVVCIVVKRRNKWLVFVVTIFV